MATTRDRPPIQCDLIGTHELDPNGDVILVFNSKHVVVSDPMAVDLINAENWNAIVEIRTEVEGGSKSNGQDAIQAEGETVTDDQALGLAAGITELENNPKDVAGQENEQENAGKEAEDTYELGSADIEFRVSSRHLSLLSPYFQVMLSRKFAEGERLHASGHVRIVLEDDPAHGAKIILSLLHLNCKLPSITPSLMMQMAILMDKWNLSDKLMFWSRRMWEDVKSHMPREWGPGTISYLKMLHMLKLQDEMTEMAVLITGELTDNIHCDIPPIQQVMERFVQYRSAVLDKIFLLVSKLIGKYSPESRDSVAICANGLNQCDCEVLGLLIRELSYNRLFPVPTNPYLGTSINGLRTALENMNVRNCVHEGCYVGGGRNRAWVPDSDPDKINLLRPIIKKLINLQASTSEAPSASMN